MCPDVGKARLTDVRRIGGAKPTARDFMMRAERQVWRVDSGGNGPLTNVLSAGCLRADENGGWLWIACGLKRFYELLRGAYRDPDKAANCLRPVKTTRFVDQIR
jgi:hypothetical protein